MPIWGTEMLTSALNRTAGEQRREGEVAVSRVLWGLMSWPKGFAMEAMCGHEQKWCKGSQETNIGSSGNRMHKWTEAVQDQDPATTEDTVYVSEGEHNRSSKGPNPVTTEDMTCVSG